MPTAMWSVGGIAIASLTVMGLVTISAGMHLGVNDNVNDNEDHVQNQVQRQGCQNHVEKAEVRAIGDQ